MTPTDLSADRLTLSQMRSRWKGDGIRDLPERVDDLIALVDVKIAAPDAVNDPGCTDVKEDGGE